MRKLLSVFLAIAMLIMMKCRRKSPQFSCGDFLQQKIVIFAARHSGRPFEQKNDILCKKLYVISQMLPLNYEQRSPKKKAEE